MSAALVAALTAHRAAAAAEQYEGSGKIHGCCVVCLVPFPCEVAQAAFDAAKEAKARAPGVEARERIAAHAMQGMLANHSDYSPADAARWAVKYADALIAELAK